MDRLDSDWFQIAFSNAKFAFKFLERVLQKELVEWNRYVHSAALSSLKLEF